MKKKYQRPDVSVQAFRTAHVLLTSQLGNADHVGGTKYDDEDEYEPGGGGYDWRPDWGGVST